MPIAKSCEQSRNCRGSETVRAWRFGRLLPRLPAWAAKMAGRWEEPFDNYSATPSPSPCILPPAPKEDRAHARSLTRRA